MVYFGHILKTPVWSKGNYSKKILSVDKHLSQIETVVLNLALRSLKRKTLPWKGKSLLIC